jgi:hypothetical protein
MGKLPARSYGARTSNTLSYEEALGLTGGELVEYRQQQYRVYGSVDAIDAQPGKGRPLVKLSLQDERTGAIFKAPHTGVRLLDRTPTASAE